VADQFYDQTERERMKITFVLKDGREKCVDFAAGDTILAVAERHHIPLRSNCEGFGVCGSCHVIIENLFDKLPEISDTEENALDKSHGVTIKSRLACQVVLDGSLDGVRIKIAH